MNKLPIAQIIGLIICLGFFVAYSPKAQAVTVAEQTQNYSSSLTVWQTIQELGTNLSGTAQSFTFRVSTSQPNLNQFDYTATNSRIYDKSNNNSYIAGCVPSNSNPNDPLRGLTFTTTGVPSGFEDVTIDFSCHNYSFIPGHRYLIYLSNANIPQFGGKTILFAAATYSGTSNDYFEGGGLRYANGNVYDYSNNSGSCSPSAYIWNGTDPWRNGCYTFTTAKDDLYFVLSNNSPPPPPPRVPVIFIPGIGGSEIKAAQDIIWSKDDGHGRTYSHAYTANEKVWVNQDEATKLGDDDYFDVLKLKNDGVTSEADLSLTGNLTQSGYGEIDSFFTGMGYVKDTNFFIFPYDWRKDVRTNKDSLDSLIEQAKTSSGQPQVNLVVHSMGGLIARYYISDSAKAVKVNKLIELGVPHLGTVESLKLIMYGLPLGKPVLKIFNIGISASETKDVYQNFPSGFQLLPSNSYFSLYTNSESDFPFRDDRDIDNNKETGLLNFSQTKTLLSNLGHNIIAFGFGEQFHTNLDSILNQTNGTKIYEIVGTAQPTLGQIHETWWITWPINLIPKTDEFFINGDDTIPLYSASLKNDSLDISGATKIYYVEQRHTDLVSANGTAMQTVKSILNDDNSLPVEVKDQKITLEGYQLSLDDGELDLYDDQSRHCGLNDNGEIEENITEVTCTTSGNTKHAFVKKKSAKVKVKATRKKAKTSSKKVTLRKRSYKQDKISKTTLYKDIPLSQTAKVEFTLDPAEDRAPSLFFYADDTKPDSTTITSTSEVSSDAALDQTPPTTAIQISGTKDSSGKYSGSVTITLTGNDTGSGILRIEYSLDNGVTVQTYSGPFTISTAGKTILQIKSIDKLGNEEIPQTIVIEIATSSTSSSGTSSSNSSSSNSSSSSNNSSTSSVDNSTVQATTNATPVIASKAKQSLDSSSSSPAVLGVSFENPSHVSDEINVSGILDERKNSKVSQITTPSVQQILGGLLVVSGGVATIASLGFAATFLKPIPK